MLNFARFPKHALRPEVFTTMKPVTVKVLACLADCLDRAEDRGRISVKAIAERCGLARRTIQLALSELSQLGLIDRNQQTGEYAFIPPSGGAPQCAGAHGDARGGAPACAGGRTSVREGAHHSAQRVARNKERPRTSYQELSYQQQQQQKPTGIPPEGGGDSVSGPALVEVVTRMIVSTGFPSPNGRDLEAMLQVCGQIQDGTFPEVQNAARGDPLGYLRPRLARYWADRKAERDSGATISPPSLRKTLIEGRWRIDPDESTANLPEQRTPKHISPERARALDRLTRRNAS